MSFSAVHKLITYLFSGLGLAALTLGDYLSLPFIALMAAGYAISFFVEGSILHRPAYTRISTALVVLFFLAQIGRAILGASPLVMGLEYAALLQISRLFNRRTARDHQQIAILALMHLIAATLLSTELTYAVVFFGFVVVTPWMLAVSHLRREIENNYTAVPASTGAGGGSAAKNSQPPAAGAAASAGDLQQVSRVLASKRLLGGRFLLGTSMLSLPLFLLTAGLFLLAPRMGLGVLSFGGGHGQRVAGFGRNVELGGFGTIRDDPSVIMRFQIPGQGASAPASLQLRLRGTSFDHYDGRRWTRSTQVGGVVPRLSNYYTLRRLPDDRDRPIFIELEQLDEPVIFIPEGAVALTVPPRTRAGFEVARNLYLSPGLDLRYLDADALGLRYTAWVAPSGTSEPPLPLGNDERRRYLAMPPNSDRVRALARQLTADVAGDGARAERILAYLRDEGRYRYSLDQPDVSGGEPLDVFLFDAKRGHCEYFSTAAAMLLRAAGVPARNVTGFLGGDRNPYGDYYSVRQGDAHSWTEAYVSGRGWVTLDATPPLAEPVFARNGPLDALRNFVDAMGRRWSEDVIGYDLERQIDLLTGFAAWTRGWAGDDGRESRDATRDGERLQTGSRSAALLVGASFLLLVFGLASYWLRRRATRAAASPRIRAARELFDALEQALRRDRSPRPPACTPTEHAATLTAAGHPQAALINEVTAAYLAVRFGGRTLAGEDLSAMRARIRAWKPTGHRKTAPDRVHR